MPSLGGEWRIFMGKKRVISCILVLVLLFGVAGSGRADLAQAASKKATALKVYKKKLKDCGSGDGFFVYDLNHDGVPELVLRKNYMDPVVYTYYKNKIVDAGSFTGSDMLVYYAKGSVFASGRLLFGTFYESFYKISKGKIKAVAGKSESENDAKPSCRISGKEVTEKKYNAYINKLTKKSKSKGWEYYPVNAKNIKKYLK